MSILARNSHIAIAGGGLLGRLLAWQLLENGHRVTLFEAGSLSQSPSAANTAAGMISPISEAIDSEPLMYDLGLIALEQWPQWLEQLANGMCSEDVSIGYSHCGSIVVAHQRDQALLQQYQQDMQRQLPKQVQCQLLDQQALMAQEPDLAEHFHQGFLLSEEAHIDNRQLLRVLLQRIQQLGGTCIENTPVEVSAYRVSPGTSDRLFDMVIDCRGVGAKPQWQQVRGVRGEVLRVHTAEVELCRPVRLLHPRYQLYIVPKPNKEFVIGATQIESEDCSPMSVRSSLELNSALYTINPAFAEARIIEMQANLRPALNDNRPQIQYQQGLIRVNGLYRHGYLLAPVIVQHTLGLLLESAVIKQDFSSVLYTSATYQPTLASELP